MKKSLVILPALALCFLAGCNDAIDYNDTIVKALEECEIAMNGTVVDHAINEEGIKNALTVCTDNKEKVEKLGAYEGDISFGNASVDYLLLAIDYINSMQERLQYEGMVEEEFTPEITEAYNTNLLNSQSIYNSLMEQHDIVANIQKTFAEKNEFMIDEESTEQ